MSSTALHKGDVVDLSIDQMAFGGSGVARHVGLVVFVRGAIPGDSLTAEVVKKKKDYAEARIVSLLEPSPDRVFAPCPYSGHCGGCQWQHVRYQRQLEYKKQHVQDALALAPHEHEGLYGGKREGEGPAPGNHARASSAGRRRLVRRR